MKAIEFKNPASQRVYNNYINRCKRVVQILSKEDQEECLMEVNSYIYEYITDHREDEMTALLNILDRLGDPEIKRSWPAKKLTRLSRPSMSGTCYRRCS